MNIVDDLLSGFWLCHISVIASTSLPKIGAYPASALCAARWTLFDRLEDLGHIVDFAHRSDEKMDVVVDEDISKHDEVMSC